jgi:methionyl-tRNA synthetase
VSKNTSTFRGGKFSKSRGAAVDVPYFLSRSDPAPLRYHLTATASEARNTPTAVLVGGRQVGQKAGE